MHDWLTALWERQGTLKINRTVCPFLYFLRGAISQPTACVVQDLTYRPSILGSDRILRALASYLSTYFHPASPVKPEHIATSNGLSSMIEHLAAVISDPGDAWLLPASVLPSLSREGEITPADDSRALDVGRPWYYSFKRDLGATSQVHIASVAIPMGQNGTLAEVEAMDAEMERRQREGVEQKVTAVLVTNPHNPLGACDPCQVHQSQTALAE